MRRRRYWMISLAPLLAGAVFLIVQSQVRDIRAREVVDDVRSVEGTVRLPPTATARVRQLLRTGRWNTDSDVHVDLGRQVTGEWLRERDYLAGVAITRLGVSGDHPNTQSLVQLIDAHPIRHLDLNGRGDVDAIAAFLAISPQLRSICISHSALSDVGLQLLPLERLERLDVQSVAVTQSGWEELRRCRQLEFLTIDGAQFTTQVSEIIAGLPRLQRLVILGGVEDDDVPLLSLCQNLASLSLLSAEMTDAGRASLAKALPGCDIQVSVVPSFPRLIGPAPSETTNRETSM